MKERKPSICSNTAAVKRRWKYLQTARDSNNSGTKKPRKRQLRIEMRLKSAHLVVRDDLLGTIHLVSAVVGVANETEAQGATTVEISGEFSYDGSKSAHGTPPVPSTSMWNPPMAVSAFSAVSNCTTPVPLDRPLGSYWISARSTFPIVLNSSTRSSLLVDQGS